MVKLFCNEGGSATTDLLLVVLIAATCPLPQIVKICVPGEV